MSQTARPDSTTPSDQPVVVKKYANRRLYNTESSSYITLDNLAEMVRAGRDFVVYDAKTGEDITRSVLTQIIVEEEGKGRAMLPTSFLRSLIGFYGDSLQTLVPRYLETTMSNFARQQQQMRSAMQQTVGNFFPMSLEEVGRQNIAMMERAMSLFSPFYPRPGQEPGAPAAPESPPVMQEELAVLRSEIDRLRAELSAAQTRAPAAQVAAAPIQTTAIPGASGSTPGAPAAAVTGSAPAKPKLIKP
jgi:polyhydroxyalkanoate synthesis repressor PhaR